MLIRRLIITLLSVHCIAAVHAQQTIDFAKGSFDEILHRAEKEKKPVLIYFTGTGCALCVKMEKNVFIQPEVYNTFNKSYISFESFDDGQKPDSATKQLRRRYGIVSNPSFIIVDAKGNLIHKAISYKNIAEFKAVGEQGLGKDNYVAWKQQLERGDYSARTVNKFLAAEQRPALFGEAGYQCLSQQVLDKYFASVPSTEYVQPDNWDIINKYVDNPFSAVFGYLVQNADGFSKRYGREAVTKKIAETYLLAWSGNRDSDHFKKTEQLLRSSDNQFARLVLQIRAMSVTSENINKEHGTDWDAFIKVNGTLLSEYNYLVPPVKYYRISDAVCKSKNVSKYAIQTVNGWMKQLLADPENEDYNYYAVYAKTYFLLGNKQDAAKHLQTAITLAIGDHADQEEIDAFRKTLLTYR